MNIIRKRIINPKRYLYALSPGDKFYIAATLTEDDIQWLRHYGIKSDGKPRIPIPGRSATIANADGRWLIHRNRPKEERVFLRTYHLVSWQGDDIYGSYVQHRMCYPRELIPPTELAFVVEEGVIYSPLMSNSEAEMPVVKAAMNIVLEMVGHCEVWTADKAPALPPVKQYGVPWEILRAGTRDEDVLKAYIEKTVERKTKAQQIEILNRHEYLWKMKPEFCVMGTQNFFGYVVYGFPKLDLYIFESNGINNATYMFRGNWEEASRLTKMEVLSGGLQEARVYHTEHWEDHMSHLVADLAREVA
ncbi:MAG: hypothetical protein IKC04_06030 [Oscillospiraceae bacterium]|nr:hypothetical protein [Oscillospiraceae bacterium]MBR2977552.1 hypothetical protein [Oscillospiraceae bacterium]